MPHPNTMPEKIVEERYTQGLYKIFQMNTRTNSGYSGVNRSVTDKLSLYVIYCEGKGIVTKTGF